MIIEKTILRYLKNKITGIGTKVYFEVPKNPPAEYILLEKTGGGRENHICKAMFAVQSIGESLQRAAEINAEVIDAMCAMPDTTEVYSCKLNSDYNYTDTATKEYRYQAVFNIYY